MALCTKGAGTSTIAQFKSCATATAQIDNLRANFKMYSQIENVLCDLQIAQIVKMRGTYTCMYNYTDSVNVHVNNLCSTTGCRRSINNK